MGHKFAELAFTPAVRQAQVRHGSRQAYARLEQGEPDHDRLGEPEIAFIAARDSFYMATVNEGGWPYIQHRGGPAGFLRILDDRMLGFADFSGNRQYVSLGNLAGNDRVSLFLMDYLNRARLKILGRARIAEPGDPVLQRLALAGYQANVERGIVIAIEAFDWNCRQHITPRYSQADMDQATFELQARVAELEAQMRQLTHRSGQPTDVV